ncbi:MAG: glycosyltransferase family 39 protein [Patescibacteria group bacterium]
MQTDKSKIFFLSFLVIVSALCFLRIFFLDLSITPESDAATYVQAMHILNGTENIPLGYVPNRMLNTFVSMHTVLIFGAIFGGLERGWLIMNLLFFFAFNAIFYLILKRIFESDKVALVGGLFLAANYGLVDFGVGYWMDISSWTFYLATLYCVLRYWQTKEYRMLIYASIAVGVGATFKEYALLGVIPIAWAIIQNEWPHVLRIVQKGIVPALISLVPVFLVYIFVFKTYGYTYADWLAANHEHYVYVSRITEYIKSFGSLYTFLAIAVIGGAYCWVRYGTQILTEKRVHMFIASVILSVLPLFLWPGITQRTSFITVPAMIMVASFFFKRFEKQWWVWIPVLIVYAAGNFLMDSVILPGVNLPF